MVRLWKIIFGLVLTMSVGVLFRLGGAFKKNRLRKKKDFLKFQKLIRAGKKSYCRHANFVSSDKLLSFQKGHFFVVFYEWFSHFLFVFVLCVCLSVPVCSLCLTAFLPPLLKVQCPNFLDIWNSWGKVIKRSGFRFDPFYSKMVSNCHGKNFFYNFFLLICSLHLTVFFCPPPLLEVQCPNCLDIWNPWGKVMERNGFRFEHFCSEMVKNCRGKRSSFYGFFHLFTSRSQMSKLYRFLEFLGKSNGNNWSQIWKLLLRKGVKSPRKKSFCWLILPY